MPFFHWIIQLLQEMRFFFYILNILIKLLDCDSLISSHPSLLLLGRASKPALHIDTMNNKYISVDMGISERQLWITNVHYVVASIMNQQTLFPDVTTICRLIYIQNNLSHKHLCFAKAKPCCAIFTSPQRRIVWQAQIA